MFIFCFSHLGVKNCIVKYPSATSIGTGKTRTVSGKKYHGHSRLSHLGVSNCIVLYPSGRKLQNTWDTYNISTHCKNAKYIKTHDGLKIYQCQGHLTSLPNPSYDTYNVSTFCNNAKYIKRFGTEMIYQCQGHSTTLSSPDYQTYDVAKHCTNNKYVKKSGNDSIYQCLGHEEDVDYHGHSSYSNVKIEKFKSNEIHNKKKQHESRF